MLNRILIGLDQNLSLKKYIYLDNWQSGMLLICLSFKSSCENLTCMRFTGIVIVVVFFNLQIPVVLSSFVLEIKVENKTKQQCLNKVIISHQIYILGNVTHMFCLCYAPVTSRLRHTIPDLWGKTIKHDLLAYILLICSTDVTFHFSLRSAS